MRRILLLGGLALVIFGAWCLMRPAGEQPPAGRTAQEKLAPNPELSGSHSIDPQRRMAELFNSSDPLPVLYDESRTWFTDQPSHMIVDRVHGGITPGQGSLPVP